MMSALEGGDKIKARSFARRLKRFFKDADIPAELEK
jgi:tRNA(Ile)-lysidine synthetase-like protein